LGVELHNGPDEERYIEGQVVIGQVRDIGGTSRRRFYSRQGLIRVKMQVVLSDITLVGDKSHASS
jgi:hypothetical protein